jgi:hypothetical protein
VVGPRFESWRGHEKPGRREFGKRDRSRAVVRCAVTRSSAGNRGRSVRGEGHRDDVVLARRSVRLSAMGTAADRRIGARPVGAGARVSPGIAGVHERSDGVVMACPGMDRYRAASTAGSRASMSCGTRAQSGPRLCPPDTSGDRPTAGRCRVVLGQVLAIAWPVPLVDLVLTVRPMMPLPAEPRCAYRSTATTSAAWLRSRRFAVG